MSADTADIDIELEVSVKDLARGYRVEAVTQVVRALPGVTEARADLGTGSVRVRGRDGELERQQVVDAICAAGYEAS